MLQIQWSCDDVILDDVTSYQVTVRDFQGDVIPQGEFNVLGGKQHHNITGLGKFNPSFTDFQFLRPLVEC